MTQKVYSLSVFRHVRKIARSDYYVRYVCPSAWNNSAPLGGFSWNLVFEYFPI